MSAATGLRFTYVGTSTYVPFAENATEHPADIVLAWATPETAPVLVGSTAGRGGAAWAGSGSIKELYDGEAVFDATQQMSPAKVSGHRARSTPGPRR